MLLGQLFLLLQLVLLPDHPKMRTERDALLWLNLLRLLCPLGQSLLDRGLLFSVLPLVKVVLTLLLAIRVASATEPNRPKTDAGLAWLRMVRVVHTEPWRGDP